uniref:IS5 family transposase n=1 Tax=Streptomyces canus TaxID=58343 RepID=UPI0027D81989|nr:IS5 family transposase [Streptomyces canus]
MCRRREARLRAAELGRSRGGLTSKVHLSADRHCRPLSFVLTPGQAADSLRFTAVLERIKVRGPVGRPRTRPAAVAADKAYASCANRAYLRRRRIRVVIPEKVDQAANRKKKGRRGGRPVAHDTGLYRDRNTVERCINKIKEWRGLAICYDKTPELPCRTAPTRRGHLAAQPHMKASTRRSPRAPTGLRARSTPGAAGR